MFVDTKAIEFFSTRMLLVKVNGKVDTLSREKYKVSGYPTNILLDNKGNEIDRLIGFAATDEFLKTMTDYAQGIGTGLEYGNDQLAKKLR